MVTTTSSATVIVSVVIIILCFFWLGTRAGRATQSVFGWLINKTGASEDAPAASNF
jgi:hypothetical protein